MGGFVADRDRHYRVAVTGLLVAAVASFCLAILLTCVGIANSRFLDALNRDVAPSDASIEVRVLRTFSYISRWEYFDSSRITSPWQRWLARAEHASPLHVSARTTLTAGADTIGPCGSLSRSMIVLLRRAGIEARKALLCDAQNRAVHTVVEVNLEGEWRVFDPTYGWYWRRPADGKIATASDLARDAVLFSSVAAQVPQYPLDRYHYDNVHHLRWDKVPGLMSLRATLVRWGGAGWVRGIGTPYLYERPVYFAGLFLVLVGGLCVALAGVLRRRQRRWVGLAAVVPIPLALQGAPAAYPGQVDAGVLQTQAPRAALHQRSRTPLHPEE